MSSGPCPDVADELTRELGGFDCSGSPLVELRDPFSLTHWSQPIVELVMIAGAVYALWWAVSRLRAHGDPTSLALWMGAVVYLFVNEPPLYFPNKFGLMETVGLNFVHNVFTVTLVYDRMPLYIVALYGAVPMLAYEAVRALGIFQRFGLVAGGVSAGMVHSAFYEIFDHIGPQYSWWAWNEDAPSNAVFFDSVPLGSTAMFSAITPAFLAYFVALFVGRQTWAGRAPRGWSLTWRTVLIGVLTPLAVVVVGSLISVQQAIGGGDTGTAVVYAVELTLVWVIGLVFVVRAFLERRAAGNLTPSEPLRRYGWIYLAVFAGLWLSALPDYVGAEDGLTSDGAPVGNLPFVVLCFVVSAAVTWMAGHGSAARTQVEEPDDTHARPALEHAQEGGSPSGRPSRRPGRG